MTTNSLHKSFGNIDDSHNQGLEFFEGKAHPAHLERKLTHDLGNETVAAIVAHPDEQERCQSSHDASALEFLKHEHTRAEEVKKFGLEKHLAGAGFDVVEAAATPKAHHH